MPQSGSGGEAHALEDRVGLWAGQIIQKGLGGLGILADVQNGGGVDDLAAHVLGCGVDDRETGGEGVGGVDDAAVNAGFLDLSGDLLDHRQKEQRPHYLLGNCHYQSQNFPH